MMTEETAMKRKTGLAALAAGVAMSLSVGQAAAQDGASVPPDEPPHDLIPLPADDQEVRDDD